MTTSQQIVDHFVTGFQLRDVGAATSVVAEDVSVTVYPLEHSDTGVGAIRTVLQDICDSFPDLLLTVSHVIELGSVVVVEMKIEGTQARDYVGVINQEKHLDVDSAWRFTIDGDAVTAIDVYWCQNQLLRRLAVKRTDQTTIV